MRGCGEHPVIVLRQCGSCGRTPENLLEATPSEAQEVNRTRSTRKTVKANENVGNK
jgi:hypothetical protein